MAGRRLEIPSSSPAPRLGSLDHFLRWSRPAWWSSAWAFPVDEGFSAACDGGFLWSSFFITHPAIGFARPFFAMIVGGPVVVGLDVLCKDEVLGGCDGGFVSASVVRKSAFGELCPSSRAWNDLYLQYVQD